MNNNEVRQVSLKNTDQNYDQEQNLYDLWKKNFVTCYSLTTVARIMAPYTNSITELSSDSKALSEQTTSSETVIDALIGNILPCSVFSLGISLHTIYPKNFAKKLGEYDSLNHDIDSLIGNILPYSIFSLGISLHTIYPENFANKIGEYDSLNHDNEEEIGNILPYSVFSLGISLHTNFANKLGEYDSLNHDNEKEIGNILPYSVFSLRISLHTFYPENFANKLGEYDSLNHDNEEEIVHNGLKAYLLGQQADVE